MLGTSSSVSYKFELFSPLQDFQRNLGDSSFAEQRPKLNDRVNVVAKYILDSIFSFLLAPKEALIFGIELLFNFLISSCLYESYDVDFKEPFLGMNGKSKILRRYKKLFCFVRCYDF